MKIRAIITGSTGMVGKGVLLECLDSPIVESVLVINRKTIGIKHEKLTEIIHTDFYDLSPVEAQLKGYNACYFCLGVSSFRMSEADYTKVTHDLTLHFAETVLRMNRGMTFTYVSGVGTDSSEKSKTMWARVKGRTENDLLKMPFKAAFMFRPGFIQPMKGIKSATKLYNAIYVVFKPLYSVLKAVVPNGITSTVQMGQAMINVITDGFQSKILHSRQINELASKTD